MTRSWQERRHSTKCCFAITLVALAFLVGRSQTWGVEVTVQGSVVCNGACIPDPNKQDHGLVVFAIDGTAEVRATVELIMKDFYADNGLDAEAAQKLMDQFSTRLKYHIAPDSPALKRREEHRRQPLLHARDRQCRDRHHQRKGR